MGVRGDDLLRPTAIVVWGDDGGTPRTVVPLHVSDVDLIGTEISSDVREGPLVSMLARTKEAARADSLNELIVVAEAWAMPGAGFGQMLPLFEVRVLAADGSILAAEVLTGMDGLIPGETGIFVEAITPSFTAASAASIEVRNLSTRSGAFNAMIVIGRGPAAGGGKVSRVLASIEHGTVTVLSTGEAAAIPLV